MQITTWKLAALVLICLGGFAGLVDFASISAPRVPNQKIETGIDAYGDALPPGAVARLGTVRFRHGSEVSHIGFSADGKKLVIGGGGRGTFDNAIRIVDKSTGRELKTFDLKPGEVAWGMDLSPDGNFLAVSTFSYAGTEGSFVIWDTATGKELVRKGCGSNQPGVVVFSPDGGKFVTQKHSRILQTNNYQTKMGAWDTLTGKLLHSFNDLENLDGRIGRPAFSPDGKRLAVTIAPYDHLLPAKGFFYDTATWSVAKPMTPRSYHFNGYVYRNFDRESIAYSPDGKLLIGGDICKYIDFMNAESGEIIERVPLPSHYHSMTSLSFSHDGTRLAIISDRDKVTIYDTAIRKVLYNLFGVRANAAVFSPTEPLLITGGTLFDANGGCSRLRFWDPITGKEILKNDAPVAAVQLTHWLPSGKLLAVSPAENCYRLWNCRTSNEIAKVSLEGKYAGCAWSVVSPDGKLLAVSQYSGQANDETILVFDLTTGTVIYRLNSKHVRLPLGFTEDGRYLLTGVDPNQIAIWDTADGKLLRTLDLKDALKKGYCSHAAISGDGKMIALQVSEQLVEPDPNDIDPGGTIRPHGYYQCVIDLTSGKKLWNTVRDDSELKGGYPIVATSFVFSPDGKILSERVGQTIRLRDSATGDILRTLDCEITAHPWAKRAEAMAFSPDSKKLIATDLRNTIYVWDIATGKELRKFTGHRGIIYSISVSPDNTMFATASEDSTVLLWRLDDLLKDKPDEEK